MQQRNILCIIHAGTSRLKLQHRSNHSHKHFTRLQTSATRTFMTRNNANNASYAYKCHGSLLQQLWPLWHYISTKTRAIKQGNGRHWIIFFSVTYICTTSNHVHRPVQVTPELIFQVAGMTILVAKRSLALNPIHNVTINGWHKAQQQHTDNYSSNN